MKILSIFVISSLLSSAGVYASQGQDVLNKLFKKDLQKELPIPEEVNESTHIGSYLSYINALNQFPYGADQIEYVKAEGIKTIVLNLRAAADPTDLVKTLTISFSSEGLVEKVVENHRNKTILTQLVTYKNGVAENVTTDSYDGQGLEINFQINDNGIALDAIVKNQGNKTLAKKILFKNDGRLAYVTSPLSGGGLSAREHTFEYNSDGALKTIKEIGQTGSNDPLIYADFAIKYAANAPSSSTRERISGYLPYYYSFTANEFMFSNNGNIISQSRIARAGAGGAIYQTINLDYTINNGAIESASSAILGNFQPVRVNWSIDHSTGDVSSVVGEYKVNFGSRVVTKFFGAGITMKNEKVDVIKFGKIFYNTSFDFAFTGQAKFNYARSGQQAYRVELNGEDNQFIATVDPEQTVFYDN